MTSRFLDKLKNIGQTGLDVLFQPAGTSPLLITLGVLIWGMVRERQKNSLNIPGPGREENA